jgi:serine/threonine protein kinase
MGRVYLARSPGSRLVALKVIRPEYVDDAGFRRRFRAEVEAARRVSGFFTAPVVDADVDGPAPWLATSYVPAPSLSDAVRSFGLLPAPALRALGAGLAEALTAIHGAGLIHRDLKPGNVLVADEGPLVIDFGISKAFDVAVVTRTGGTIGTPGYMAPEQIASGREVATAVDVFALGCVLAFAATGRSPFGPGARPELLYRAVHEPANLGGVPGEVLPLISACLDKDPARRPSVEDVLAGLGPVEPGALMSPHLRQDLADRREQSALLLATPYATPYATPVAGATATVGMYPLPDQHPHTDTPNRRRFLGVAGAVGVTGIVAAGTAITLSGHGKPSPPAPAPDSTTSSSPDPTPHPPTTTSTSSGPPPGPAATWSTTVQNGMVSGRLRVLDSTVLWLGGHTDWLDNQIMDTTACGIDATTGRPTWAGTQQGQQSVSIDGVWYDVYGPLLYAFQSDASTGTWTLFGVDATGKQAFLTSLGKTAGEPTSLFGVAGGIALLGGQGDLIAFDVTARKTLWSPSASEVFGGAIDQQRAYYSDGSSTYALNPRTGAVLWTAPNTAGVLTKLTVTDSILILQDTKVTALDTATGKHVWTAVNVVDPLAGGLLAEGRYYVVDSGNTLYAIDVTNGKVDWRHAGTSRLQPDNGGLAASATQVAVAVTTPVPGFLVMNTESGKVLWQHTDSHASPSSSAGTGPATSTSPTADTGIPTASWAVAVSGSTVYAAFGTTISAFPIGAS